MSASELRPVVLIGAARSGTKILRDSLAVSLGAPSVPYDVGYVWRYGNETRTHDCLRPSEIKPKTRRLVRSFVGSYANSDGWVVEKTVGNSLRVPFVADVLPEAVFVHVIRDGVDVAESARREWEIPSELGYLVAKMRHFPLRLAPTYGRKFVVNAVVGCCRRMFARQYGHARSWGPRYPGIDRDLVDLGLLAVTARQWRESVEAADRDLALIPQRVVVVRYESLVSNPATTLRRLVKEIGATVQDSRINAASAMIVSGSPGKGRQNLNLAERHLLEREIGRLLMELGYDAP